MDRFIIGPKPRSVLSYFLADPESQTIEKESFTHPRAAAAAAVAAAHETPARLSVNIFCDGACINNGRRGAHASFGMAAFRGGGVSLGEELYRVAQVLSPSEPQTNQRAELRGLAAAVNYAGTAARAGATTIRIYTDSEYALNCLTKWISGWKRSGWRRADGAPVLHRDILEPLYDAWTALRGVAFLTHVAAHTGRTDALSLGNERADALARSALTNAISGYF
jgi:ribonuclease HI